MGDDPPMICILITRDLLGKNAAQPGMQATGLRARRLKVSSIHRPAPDAGRWAARANTTTDVADIKVILTRIQSREDRMTRSEKTLCVVYAVIAVVALVVTQANNIAFFRQPDNGGLVGWVAALYANPAVASFTNDVIAYGVAGYIFMVVEARRLGIRHVWVYLLLSSFLAVGVMFPLFLIARQITMAKLRVQPSVPENISSAGSSR